MSFENYITALKNTKTFQAGLISFQEYKFKKGLIFKSIPNLPYADEDRHVVVVEIRGNQPNIRTVLKEPGHTFHATTKDIDKLLFVFVEMRPDTFKIDNPAAGYKLGDGHRIDAQFKVVFKVTDARELWRGSRDPLAELEMSIMDAARTFFLGRSSASLIGGSAEIKQSVEQHILEGGAYIKIIKDDLEESIKTSICSDFTVTGVALQRVLANVDIGDSLQGHLSRIIKKLYEDGGVADRHKIDQIIDNDRTFAPYSLREVIHALDMRLIENFYMMTWSEAMRKITGRLAEKKEEYIKSAKQNELEKIRELIATAENLNLDKKDIDDLKFKAGDILNSMMSDNNNSFKSFSDSEYLKIIINPSSDRLLELNEKDKPAIEEE